MNIVIRKLVVEYSVKGNPGDNNPVRQADLFVKNTIIPLLEKLLAQIEDIEEYQNLVRTVSLPHISIDLDFSKTLSNLAGMSGLLALSEDELAATLKNQLLLQIKERVAERTPRLNSWQQLFFIIGNGYKNWSYLFLTHQEFEARMLNDLELLLNDESQRLQFVYLISDTVSLKRLQNVVTPGFLKNIITAIAKFYLEEIPILCAEIIQAVSNAPVSLLSENRVKTIILFYSWLLKSTALSLKRERLKKEFSGTNKTVKKNVDFFWSDIQFLIKEVDKAIAEETGQVQMDANGVDEAIMNEAIVEQTGQKKTYVKPKKLKGKNVSREINEEIGRINQGIGRSINVEESIDPAHLSTNIINSAGTSKTEPRRLADLTPEGSKSSKRQQEELLRDGVFCENAGIIILAPFFEMLFERLKLTDGDLINNPSKAAYAVQYLTGAGRFFEQDMIIPKLLCGVEIEAVLEPNKRFLKKEIVEMNGLLGSLNAHWPAIKNTGTETIQQMFFQRDGKLIIDEDEMTLILEKRTEDILLSYIPWTFKMIRLPWMTKVLKVE